jgi:nucleoside 2-deoxyribosyltransferase
MGSDEKNVSSSTKIIGEAVESLLQESTLKSYLEATHTKPLPVQIPENWMGSEIVRGIMERLDTADLVIVNLTPFSGITGSASPNVFYELGLLHALGMPVICIAQEGTEIPFYARHNRIRMVKNFEKEAVKDQLRLPINNFLDPKDSTDFTDNRITQFYGLPIVDISAAVGLATGYYQNFVFRLLDRKGILPFNKDKVSRLIIVRPQNIMHEFEEDKERLEEILKAHGYSLQEKINLSDPLDSKGRGLNVDCVGSIILDIPSTIYPLKKSPRMLSLTERLDKTNGYKMAYNPNRDITLRQLSDRLLDRVKHAIIYHVRKDAGNILQDRLDFATMEEVPEMLKQYGVEPDL